MNSIANKAATLIETLQSIVHQKGGALTSDLLREPGRFGLGQTPSRLLPDATTDMVCGYCSTGCSLRIHLKDGEAVNLTPTTDYPVNLGMACPKGWEALSVLDAEDRATTPLLRNNHGDLVPVSWDEAMRTLCVRFKEIGAEHGPESVAFLSTGQLVTEEMALLGALAKFGMGMIHGDGNTRQCMATAATAYKQSFGFDAPPFTYQDFEESDVIVLVGSNLCVAHPIMWERVCRNPHNPQVVVIDPRRTETAMQATLHLPIKPKSDLTFFYALAHVLVREGWIDRAFIDASTTGFESFADFVRDYPPQRAAEATGIAVELIETLARMFHEGKRVSFWWTMGVNQSYEGTRIAQSLINLALMTGNIGRPGTGANSITGQCNAMGSRLFSNTTGLFAGRDFKNAEDRREVADILDLPIENIPTVDSLPYHQIIEGIRSGAIRGLWVLCTNTAHSWIHQEDARELLSKLDFLVVQDMYATTETAQQADLVLPAAGWGEKEGTFINSERRIGVVKKVRRPPGEALPDFAIFRLVAEYWGCGERFRRWTSPEAAFGILQELSQGRPCDLSGMGGYAAIDHAGGAQWPCVEPVAEVAQQRRLFEDGRFYHEDEWARFIWEDSRPMPEAPDDSYPYLLLTGRGAASQWHTQTRTSKSPVLRKLSPQNIYIEMHPDDARAAGVAQHSKVAVSSRRGRLEATAFLTPTVQPGQVFIPMHYEATNRLTLAHFDPYSHQPSYKACAVKIEALEAKR
ncbi:molybdopterin oxidoreductase family protein [Botrimarina mediterranea]|uniref:Nitrate reductase n=1 Tax=Botrimarina mediterranea TaxID=2528022 RepID=A0A518K803_9BACT|nr:nitrate reductase [Botrimarina mediterranea]QDV73928.1 Nitrate reductase [Botrimarina mediterranea]